MMFSVKPRRFTYSINLLYFIENSLYVFDISIIESLSLTVKRNLYRLFYYQNR